MSGGTVLVVDDNDDFRHSVAWMIRGEGYETVEFACAAKAIRALELADGADLRRSCLLLDVRMPDISGLDLHRKLNAESISVPIVYMTGHADVPLAVEAMRLGAVTFLEKPLDPVKLTDALETALGAAAAPGAPGAAPAARGGPEAEYCERFRTGLGRLTPRERDVLDGIVDGGANKRIAYDLGISVRTVEVHRARVMRKLGARNVSELLKLVLTCSAEPR